MSTRVSALERARRDYRPRSPRVLADGLAAAGLTEVARPAPAAVDEADALRAAFPRTFGRPAVRIVPDRGGLARRPLRVGVVLSGGQAPGGHNVVVGLADGIRALDAGSRLFGFLGGPRGILTGDTRELGPDLLEAYRNTGGFDLIGSGRDKIETDEQLAACRDVCAAMDLDGLLVVGGDDSNTNAAVLAESFEAHGVRTAVVGAPKTIDGDLKGGGIEISFGFDTATKVYSELIGNIARDARSAGKYWHFVRLMGRSASHVTLECALATQPNVVLVGEEVRERGATLDRVVEDVARVVARRAEVGRDYGVCLLPEGLIEFVPEMGALIGELNRILGSEADAFDEHRGRGEGATFLERRLSPDAAHLFGALPERIREQLLLDRDAHGNVQVSKIDTEALVTAKVARLLARWKDEGRYRGKFSVQTHFLGYEGRSAAPSNFDADYTWSLGRTAALLVAGGRGGTIASIGNLAAGPQRWEPRGIPLTSLMGVETRRGRRVPVIAKALVRLDTEPFATFARERTGWEVEDDYVYPGPVQYFGPEEVAGRITETLRLESGPKPWRSEGAGE